jgi:hypothetical protein
MQAFLQRIINGGGHINREYSLGANRTDLFIVWSLDVKQGIYGPLLCVVIELKMLYGRLETTMENGLEQTAYYAMHVGADEAHLVIFDREPKKTWEEKIWQSEEKYGDYPVTVWGA